MFTSEKVVAYELGYRTELSQSVSASISTFYNTYDDLRSIEPVSGNPGQAIILNGMSADTYGVELSATWQSFDFWRVRGGYTFFKKQMHVDGDLTGGTSEGNDPHHQFLLQSMVDLPAHFEVDTVLRYVDNLDQLGPTVPAYVAVDLRLAWHPKPSWEIAVVGQNLTDNQHPEFGPPGTRQEIPRSVYGKVTWKF
jgi:iron complex outermembrane receptor protein